MADNQWGVNEKPSITVLKVNDYGHRFSPVTGEEEYVVGFAMSDGQERTCVITWRKIELSQEPIVDLAKFMRDFLEKIIDDKSEVEEAIRKKSITVLTSQHAYFRDRVRAFPGRTHSGTRSDKAVMTESERWESDRNEAIKYLDAYLAGEKE